MKRRLAIILATLTALSIAFAPLAAAVEYPVQFQTQSVGGRTLSATTPPAFPAVTNLVTAGGDFSTTSVGGVAASATVTELFAQGGTWSVSAQMCGPNNYATPTASDCTNHANRMVRAAGTSLPAADILEGSLIAVSHGTPVIVAGGGTTTTGAQANLAGTITLLNNTGQNAGTAYNGTYTSTTNLSVTDFDRVGTWKGYWIVTALL